LETGLFKRKENRNKMSQSPNHCRHAIIVLGMHRSGTSALTGILNRVGVNLGDNLLAPQADNPAGFWENIDVYNANEKLLQDLNSSWDDVRSLPDGWWDFDVAKVYKFEIISILERYFANSSFWGVKDPRICRLLPLWRPMLEQTGNKSYFLIIIRNPLEIVTSLSKRDSFPKGKSCLLWLKHLMDAEKETRNTNRIFVTYEKLLSDWKGLLTQIEKTFGFKWPVDLKKAAPQVEAFLTNSLRHNIISDDILVEDETLSKWISDSYLAAKEAVDGDDRLLINTMNTIEAELREADKFYTSVLTDFRDKYLAENVELQKKDLEIERLNRHLEESHQVKGYQLSEIEHLQVSITERDKRIQGLDAEVTSLHEVATERDKRIQGLDAEVAGLREGITERDERIQGLDAEVAGLRDGVREREDQIQQFHSQIDSLQIQIGAERLSREVILNSRSWKVTAPLRWMSLYARKLKRKVKTVRYLINRQYRLIKNSSLFDTSFYLEQNPDVALSGVNPIIHYIVFGTKEGRDPSSLFCTSFYLLQNPDVADSGMNPLAHYVKYGFKEGRDPNASFNSSNYLKKYQAVTNSSKNFQEYLRLFRLGRSGFKRDGFYTTYEKTKNHLKQRKIRSVVAPSDYKTWIKKWETCDKDFKTIREEIKNLKYLPKISIIMPVYNVDQIWLEKVIKSVLRQLYENWELCIVDDASTKKHIKKTLKLFSMQDKRIKIKYLDKNQGISGASNEALSLATGDFIGLIDNDDELSIDALFENLKLLNKHPEADLIYSDEDKIETDGTRCEPFFKPDWSPDTFLSVLYINHFSVYRKSIVDEIGGFRKGYEGSQDSDFNLRFIEKTKNIFHIPKILYHWRKIPGSAASGTSEKSYAYGAAKKALNDYLERNKIDGQVIDGYFPGAYRIKRRLLSMPKISIIIPFKDQVGILKKCVNSIIRKSSYKNYEIVLINNNSEEKETFHYLDALKTNPVFKILNYNKPFNFSALNNYAVSKIKTEYIIFLNNDIEIISNDWIESMLEHAQRNDVGAVGAQLYYPNDTLQHAGIIIGIEGGVAGHPHKNSPKDSPGYFGRQKIIQNLSAVTAACLMTKKSILNEVDGFDQNLALAYNDVDLCLKMREKDYLIIYTPYAELYHHESLSRGYDISPEKLVIFKNEEKRFKEKWKDILKLRDPYYNKNLTKEKGDFSLRL